MKTFGLCVNAALAPFNLFIGYAGTALAIQQTQSFEHEGIALPAITEFTLSLPPWAYALGMCAILTTILGVSNKMSGTYLIYTAFGLMLLDILGLMISVIGYAAPHFLLKR